MLVVKKRKVLHASQQKKNKNKTKTKLMDFFYISPTLFLLTIKINWNHSYNNKRGRISSKKSKTEKNAWQEIIHFILVSLTCARVYEVLHTFVKIINSKKKEFRRNILY